MKTRAQMKKQYKETALPMGVFLVRNTQTNRFILGTSLNLDGALNKYRFVLRMGNPNDLLFKNPEIVEDYKVLGEGAFEFSVLDTLKPKEETGWDPAPDLQSLEEIWREELARRGWKAY